MIPEPTRLPILETERLRLAPLVLADAGRLFPLMEEPEVAAYWDVAEIDDPDLVAVIVETQVAAMAGGQALHWSLRTLSDDAFLGCCSLSEMDRGRRQAEVGFLLGRGAWGDGYGVEAMRAVVAHAGASGLRKLTARTHLGNRRSEQLLETLGFREEGLLRGHVVRDSERRDGHVFGLLL